MKSTFGKGFLPVCILCLIALLPVHARAQDPDLTYSVSFTDQELDDLLAPIALYPDPLLAQMLPASTYPAEIEEADAWLSNGGDPANIDDQYWDESVKAIVRYPDVLRMMADSMDWTANLGDAFLNQPEDVANAIQRLRQQARELGNLFSNDKQTVVVAENAIEIVPVQPQYVYVPRYDPVVVYVQRPTYLSVPFILFGPPLLLGGWLTLDFDWGHHHVIYHGWNRPGWVNHARPYVHVSNVYINKSRPLIRQAWKHDTSRGGPARYLAAHPSGPNANRYVRTGEIRGRTTSQPKQQKTMFGPTGNTSSFSKRGRESRGIVHQQRSTTTPRIDQRGITTTPGPIVKERRIMPTPKSSRSPLQPRPDISTPRVPSPPTVTRKPQAPAPAPGKIGIQQPRPPRETAQQPSAKTPSVTFGGYRGAGETKAQSVRGQTSRQSSAHVPPSAPPGGSRGNVPDKSGASREKQRR